MKTMTGFVCLFTMLSINGFASSASVATELKELRAEKRRIADAANQLGALARVQHLTSWETHALVLSELKSLINSSGRRIERIQNIAGPSLEVDPLRDQLSQVAAHVTRLKERMNDNRLVVRMPFYYTEVQKLVRAAEQSEVAAERLMASALSSDSSRTSD